MKDNTNDNNLNTSLTEQLAFDKMDVPDITTFGIAPPNPLFDGDVLHSTLTSAARTATSTASRASMMGSHLSAPRIEDTEYMNRKQMLTGVGNINPYVTFSPWANVIQVMTYLTISNVEFTMSNVGADNEFEFVINDIDTVIPTGEMSELINKFKLQIVDSVCRPLINNGVETIEATVKANVLGNVEVEFSLDGTAVEKITLPAFSNNPIKYTGESELRHLQGVGDLFKDSQLDQLFPRGHVSDINSEIFRHPVKGMSATTEIFILNEVKAIHHTVTRDELTNIKVKHKWFNNLIPVEQQMYKVAMLSNNAHTYRAVDCEVPEQWQRRTFEQTVGLVPRYSNSRIQPCNLVFKTDSDRLGIYSIYSSMTKRDDVCNAMYLRDWSEGLSSKRYYRCDDGKDFTVIDLDDETLTPVYPGTPEYVLVESKFRVYGNIFAYRLEQYENKVKDSIPVGITYRSEETLEEALAWYLEDITVDIDMAHDEKYLITCSEALPKLKRYRGELSKPTGRKMAPHDRTSHKNRRYNPDGTVRMEWEVAATEINGGAKARFGLQISNIIPHLTK